MRPRTTGTPSPKPKERTTMQHSNNISQHPAKPSPVYAQLLGQANRARAAAVRHTIHNLLTSLKNAK